MRSMKSVGLLAALLLIAASATSLVAWGEISLGTGGTGEATWWYIGEHGEVCGTVFDDACTTTFGDQYSVELASFQKDDWALAMLDCASRFAFDKVDSTSLSVVYRMLENAQIGPLQANSGPRMAFWVENNGTGDDYLVISAGAPVQTSSCNVFQPGAGTWYWGAIDTVLISGREYPDIASLPATPSSGSFGGPGLTAQNAYGGPQYVVKAIAAVMGAKGANHGGAVGAGQALVDNVGLTWTDTAGTTFGGTYRLEKAWPQTVGFEDSTTTPPGDPAIPPFEWAKWCVDPQSCPHCLPVDDENLWRLVKETDFPSSVPSAARTFPSGDYALYFGVATEGSYDVSQPAVGMVCSPYNDVNPGDQYVSLSFEYFRQVESYMGQYDWTFVQIWFDDWSVPGGLNAWYDPLAEKDPVTKNYGAGQCVGWKTIWYMDSKDPSNGQWNEAVITHYVDPDGKAYTDDAHRILIPPQATRMRIRFGFNTKDGSSNDYLGWIIDNIVKTHTPAPSGCRIVTDFLPQGEVGDKYPGGPDDSGFLLQPQLVDGSTTGPRAWSIVSVTKDGQRSTLPRRLALDPSGRLFGDLDPGTSGTYEITFHLECWDGRPQEKTLVLNVRAPSSSSTQSLMVMEDFEALNDLLFSAAEAPGAQQNCPELWHQTNEVRYALQGAAKTEYNWVAYFGKDDMASNIDPNYACQRAKGCMESLLFQVTKPEWDEQELIIGFKSWRNVEPFAGGEYDKTWVEARVEGGNWKVVWSKSSKDAEGLGAWTWQEAHTGLILQQGKKIQVRFCFDSIDGYGNRQDGQAFGWLVDEISLYAGGAELSISACPLGETTVGEYYHEELTAAGGSNITPKWEISAGELPPGLGLVEDQTNGRKAYITGSARTEGRFDFTIRVRDISSWDEVATRQCTIIVTRNVTLLFEDFENDPAWGGTGLWHYTGDGQYDALGKQTQAPVKGVTDLGTLNHAAYYGRNDMDGPNYDTGARTDGMLTLVAPVISLAGIDAVKVQFDFWRDVEDFGKGGYDKTYVQVKLGDGDWKTIWLRDSQHPSKDEWISTEDAEETPIATFLTGGAPTMLIRFVFDSMDKWYNKQIGWLIDNIKIHSAPAAGANPLSLMRLDESRTEGRDTPTEFQVMNIPNPVTDVHTTTFTVRSEDVEAMRVAIYDLAGNKVYEEEVPGNELVWHTDNDYGEFLANGIYLYRAYVLMNGVWVETTVQKLVILR